MSLNQDPLASVQEEVRVAKKRLNDAEDELKLAKGVVAAKTKVVDDLVERGASESVLNGAREDAKSAERALDRAERALDRAIDAGKVAKAELKAATEAARLEKLQAEVQAAEQAELNILRDSKPYWEALFTPEAKGRADELCKPAGVEGDQFKEEFCEPTGDSKEFLPLENGLGFKFAPPLDEDATNAQIAFLEGVSSPYIIGATSGAGKSQLMYQYASKHHSIYLQCAGTELLGRPSNQLMVHMIGECVRMAKYDKGDNTLSSFVLRMVNNVMRRGLKICEDAREVASCIGWTPKQFLVAQLLPNFVFGNVQNWGLDVFVHAYKFYSSFEVVDKLVLVLDTPRRVLVDEAQVLQKKLVGTIKVTSKRNSNGERSLFHALFRAGCLSSGVVYSGTGISMLEAMKSNSSGAGHTKSSIPEFKMWNKNDVVSWLGRYVDKVDDRVACWLVGRPRWSTALVSIMVKHPNLSMSAAFEALCRDQFGTSNERGVYRVVKDAQNGVGHVAGVMTKEERNSFLVYLLRSVVRFMFGGTLESYDEKKAVFLVQSGLGYFEKGMAVVKEPLVVNALVLYKMLSYKVGVVESFHKFAEEYLQEVPEGRPLATEWCVVFLLLPWARLGLPTLLKGSEFAKQLGGSEAFHVFSTPLTQSSEPNKVRSWFLQWMFEGNVAGVAVNNKSAEHGSPGLSHWMESRLNGRHGSLVYYPDDNCGPDLVFCLLKGGKVVAFVFVQVKVGNGVAKTAWNTIDPNKLYHSRKDETGLRGGFAENAGLVSEQLQSESTPVIRVLWSLNEPNHNACLKGILKRKVGGEEVVDYLVTLGPLEIETSTSKPKKIKVLSHFS